MNSNKTDSNSFYLPHLVHPVHPVNPVYCSLLNFTCFNSQRNAHKASALAARRLYRE